MRGLFWSDKMKHALLYWRSLNYDFYFISGLMEREFSCKVSRPACIGMHNRLTRKGVTLDTALIKEYLP